MGAAQGPGGLRIQFAASGFMALSLAVFQLLITVALARWLGTTDYGFYVLLTAWLALCSLPVQSGITGYVVREVAADEASGEPGRIRALLIRMSQFIGVFSLCAAALLVTASVVDALPGILSDPVILTAFVLTIPLMGFNALRNASLRGLHKSSLGLLPERIVRPGAMLVLVLLGAVWLEQGSTRIAMVLAVLSFALAFICGSWLLYRNMPLAVSRATPSDLPVRAVIRGVLPFSLLAGVHQLYSHLDVVMLGAMASAEEVGIYRIATRGALVVNLAVYALQPVIASRFARLARLGELQQLQRLAVNCARLSVALAVIPAALLIIDGERLVSFIFGAEYRDAAPLISLLTMATLAAISFGPVVQLLNMAGYQNDALRVVILTASFNVLLNLLLIPRYGMLGAAWSTAACTLVLNLGCTAMLWHRMGFMCAVISPAASRVAAGRKNVPVGANETPQPGS